MALIVGVVASCTTAAASKPTNSTPLILSRQGEVLMSWG
jgi:hypothetical protein